jgi:hypothetical protein
MINQTWGRVKPPFHPPIFAHFMLKPVRNSLSEDGGTGAENLGTLEQSCAVSYR